MCGIAGIIAPICAEEARDRLVAMLGQIAYRGPDECTGAVGDGFAIGTARLSIVDLVTGTQPAISGDGKTFVVFNGEIFNYRDLRASLAAKGHTFRSNSEVEVLLHLYQEHGPAMASTSSAILSAFVLCSGGRMVDRSTSPLKSKRCSPIAKYP